MGTMAISSSWTAETMCPVVIYKMENTPKLYRRRWRRIHGDVHDMQDKLPEEQENQAHRRSGDNSDIYQLLLAFFSSGSLVAMRNGKFPKASITMNKGINVRKIAPKIRHGVPILSCIFYNFIIVFFQKRESTVKYRNPKQIQSTKSFSI